MSALQYELMKLTTGLSDASMKQLIWYVRTSIAPFDSFAHATGIVAKCGARRKIGALAGEKFLSDGYDFDASNGEIAEMFKI